MTLLLTPKRFWVGGLGEATWHVQQVACAAARVAHARLALWSKARKFTGLGSRVSGVGLGASTQARGGATTHAHLCMKLRVREKLHNLLTALAPAAPVPASQLS